MDKKQIMKMGDTWKDFRLTEAKAKHGFDLTDFKPGGFKKLLKVLGIPMVAKHKEGYGFYWKGMGIEIITGNNPITGKFNRTGGRKAEKNYASYMGIEGDDAMVKTAVKHIKLNTSYRKGESVGKRDFI